MEDAKVDSQLEEYFSRFDENEGEDKSESSTDKNDIEDSKDNSMEESDDNNISKSGELNDDIYKAKLDKSESEDKTDDDDVPFHKHPRFQELIKDKNSMQKEMIEWKKEKVELLKQIEDSKNSAISDEELEGMTPQEIMEYSQSKFERDSKYKQELEKLETDEAEIYIDETLQKLKDEGETFDEDELLKISSDYTDGDIEKGLELYKRLNQTKEEGKKEGKKETAKKKAAESNTSNRGSSKGGSKFVSGTDWNDMSLS